MNTPLYEFNEKMMPGFLSGFDSTSSMLNALGNYLRGDDIPGAGIAPPVEMILKEVGQLTRRTRETIYSLTGFLQAVSPERLDRIQSEQMSKWVINKYPKRQYPAIAIGSTNGALLHLQVALGIPWLPQTFLIPVRRPSYMHVDDPGAAMEWAREPADRLLRYNPDLRLHHMFDPNMDRLMLEYMTCFRVKKLRLGTAYERFIRDTLPSGGTILISECRKKWPTTRVDNRHVFQFGGPDGASVNEYFGGGDRVGKYLEQHNSPFRSWEPPSPDGESPEAQWGFDPALYEDIGRIAKEGGYKVQRIVFEEPAHPSPFVAELYRWWYKQRRIMASRLLASSFTRIDPYRTFRTGSVPFWTQFSTEKQAQLLDEYLKGNDKYDEIFLMRYIHGVEGLGYADARRWQKVLDNAVKKGELLEYGHETDSLDLALMTEFNPDLENRIKSRYPVPGPLGFKAFTKFIKESKNKFKVRFEDSLPEEMKPPVAETERLTGRTDGKVKEPAAAEKQSRTGTAESSKQQSRASAPKGQPAKSKAGKQKKKAAKPKAGSEASAPKTKSG